MPGDEKLKGFNIFRYNDDVSFNREGKTVYMRGRDNTGSSSDTVEANLLLEILKALKKK